MVNPIGDDLQLVRPLRALWADRILNETTGAFWLKGTAPKTSELIAYPMDANAIYAVGNPCFHRWISRISSIHVSSLIFVILHREMSKNAKS